jgi:hypothetical protein
MELGMLGIDACRGRVEYPSRIAPMTRLENIQIYLSGIVHDRCIVLAGEDKSGASHISRKLVYFVEATIDRVTAGLVISQITQNKIVSLGFAENRVFEVDASYPVSRALQSPHEMRTDKTAGAADKCFLHRSNLC